MELGLSDRVYVLTGATKGLGFATARCLVADGARVIVSSRSQESVDKAVAELGSNAAGIVADLADPGTPDALVAAAHDRFGRLDGALISVGGPPAGGPLDATDEQWTAAFNSVFLGAVRMARTVAGVLGEGGAIAFVLSTSVRTPLNGLAVSNGLRPGLAMWAKDLADALGPRGVRVVSLLPGSILTDRGHQLLAGKPDPAKAKADTEARIPLRRMGEPAEFGRVAAFVLSPAASYLTGIALPVDGGILRAL
ncbi:SDR family oxidoreductase [Virgisporangium aurantiacum]|uniref:Oxidoreductase n=1 Tax=Virgisporangium aurantiacum TaxID=175570 RepID=A0A8J3Z7V2_9ACTN|nr:SDR family oxidoreductase [Virgisporangium aurantiacum]GIJ58981.1 oxidoreductase [Virgisporangium aurantiacum]